MWFSRGLKRTYKSSLTQAAFVLARDHFDGAELDAAVCERHSCFVG